MSAELNVRAARPKVLNCLCAGLRSVSSETKNTLREGENWVSEAEGPHAIPCPAGAPVRPADSLTATVFGNLGD